MAKNNEIRNPQNGKSIEPDGQWDNLKKINPFEVPKDYFESLPGMIQERIAEKKEDSISTQMIKWMFQPVRVTVLASILIIATVGYLFLFDGSGQEDVLTFNDIMLENPEIIEYMDEDLLVELVAEEFIEPDWNVYDPLNVVDSQNVYEELIFQLSEDEITDFLINL